MKKYVISGGANSGKTTIINELKKKGFRTIPEAARMVIKECQKIKEWTPEKNFYEFEIKILNKQLRMESEKKEGIVFLDRGIVDTFTYLRQTNKDIPEKIIKLVKERDYEKIFFLEMLPTYERDDERWENEERARKTHELIKKNYTKLGYDIINVPLMNVRERTDFILKKIKEDDMFNE